MRSLRVACAVVVLVALGATPASAQPKPRKVAFLVGVGTYQFNFTDLNGAPENDVTKLRDALDLGGFDEVHVLTNENATKQKLLAKFKDVLDGNGVRANAIGKKDVILVALCGHGYQAEVVADDGAKEERQFFCTHDAFPDKYDSMVSLNSLIDAAKGHGAATLFLIDACREVVDQNRGMKSYGSKLPQKVAVLFSCLSGQLAAQSNQLKHGLFTYAVLQALDGAGRPAGAESVSWSELVGTVEKTFASPAFKQAHNITRPQTPTEMKGELGYVELVALRRVVKVERPKEIPQPPKNFLKEDQEAYERMLFTGRGTRPYFEEAGPKRIQRWKEAAEAGDPVAQVLYGRCFYLGVEVKQDYDAAAAWYKKSADQGDVRGLLNLGASTRLGHGVPKDLEKGTGYYQKAVAATEYPPALDALATSAMYAGRHAEALGLFKRGIAAGYPQSMFGLGLMYQDGLGVPQNSVTATEWYQKAVDAELPDAMRALGLAYANGRGVPRNPKKAVELFKMASAVGDTAALNDLGLMYQRGAGVVEDKPLAAGYFKSAAEKGVAEAMYNLGVMYEQGIGVRPSRDSAIFWFRRGAEKGDNDAKLGLKRLGG